MVAPYVAHLESLVSQPRLERERPQNSDDLETAINYLWNVALSEALLQGLSAVEVGLRNSVHRGLTAELGTEYWFWPFLLPEEFDHFNADWLTRGKVESRVKLFVDLRNRVMHHAPIFLGIARPDEQQPGQPMPVVSLADAHQHMLDVLSWIDPQQVGH